MKKKNILGAVIIISIGIIIIAITMVYSSYSTKKDPNLFNPKKANAAEKLYNSLSDIDFENGYPSTPEKVVRVYCDAHVLLYNDMIVDEEIKREVFSMQRKLYGKRLAEAMTAEEEYEEYEANIENLLKEKALTVQMEVDAGVYSEENQDICYVPVAQYVAGLGRLDYVYYLEKQDGLWKIILREYIPSE